jgi:hypothetical protein
VDPEGDRRAHVGQQRVPHTFRLQLPQSLSRDENVDFSVTFDSTARAR